MKEWIAQLCPPQIRLFRSPKSYNSQIGVALSLLMAEPDDRIVLIEAGISQRGEMARLERMIRPDLGIVTNIGDAHQENFDSPRQKADEKLTLFEHTPTIVYNAADPLLARLVPERYDDRKLIGVEPAERELDGLPFDDPASRTNAALALALYGALGFDTEPIRKRLPRLQKRRHAARAQGRHKRLQNRQRHVQLGYQLARNRAAIPVGNERKPR